MQAYNAENRLSGVLQVTGDCDTLGDTLKAWQFTYDGDGAKVKQEYTDSYGTLTTYYYGGGSYEVQSDGSTEITRQYYALAGVSAGMREGNSFSWFLTDHLGSVVGVTDADATLISQTRYTPFGETRTEVGTINQTDYGYTFQRNVDGMGLMDYKARYYSSLLGRFTQPDTLIPGLASPQMWNRYGYVNNNPLNFNDPSGHIAGCDRNDWACQFHWDIPVFDEVLYEPTPYDPLIEIIATIVWEPLDWMITIDDIQRGDGSPWMLIGLLPVVPGSIGKHIDDMGLIRKTGQMGELLSGLEKNAKRIPSMSGTAAYRIPDGLDDGAKVISEVKNVGTLSLTKQLKDFLLFSEKEGYRFELYTRATTRLSKPLQSLIGKGAIIKKTLLK